MVDTAPTGPTRTRPLELVTRWVWRPARTSRVPALTNVTPELMVVSRAGTPVHPPLTLMSAFSSVGAVSGPAKVRVLPAVLNVTTDPFRVPTPVNVRLLPPRKEVPRALPTVKG